MAYGYVAYDPEIPSVVLFEGNGKCGEGTSNIAEYRGLISGLYACRRHGVRVVHIAGDSQLVVNQVNKTWRVNKEDLIEHRNKVWELLANFEDWSLKWVPRDRNRYADRLVNLVFERGKEKCLGKSKSRFS